MGPEMKFIHGSDAIAQVGSIVLYPDDCETFGAYLCVSRATFGRPPYDLFDTILDYGVILRRMELS